MFFYSAFGLSLLSDLHIPGLLPADSQADSDAPRVRISLGRLTYEPASASDLVFRDPILEGESPGVIVRTVAARDDFVLEYADGTRFLVRADGGEVSAEWPAHLTLEDTAVYLLGPVLALVLRLHGRFALHAGVVALDERAIALAGGPEAGKSTLVAAFALRGRGVLSDDVAPLEPRGGTFWIHPTYPRVRLWGDSVERLAGSVDALPLLTPTWDKRYLDVAERGVFDAQPRRLAAIFVLHERSAAGPRIERLSGRDAFAAVLAQLHTVWMMPASPQREVFDMATRIVTAVPVFRVTPHSDAGRIGELCDRIEETTAALSRTREADVRAS